jgi:hypothetical protein
LYPKNVVFSNLFDACDEIADIMGSMKDVKTSSRVVSNKVVLVEAMVLLGVILCIGSLWGWWHYIRSNPERVFWGAVNNSLQTSTVTRQFAQNGDAQSLDQRTQLQTVPKQITAGGSTLVQGQGADKITVLTDLHGTPYVDFIRYASIQTDQQGVSGQKLDFSSAVGVWGKGATQDEKVTSGQLYNQAALAAVPFGNLTVGQRAKLMGIMRDTKAYEFEAKNVTRTLKNHRPTYDYVVVVKPEGYINVLKEYSKMVGLNQLANVDPADYRRRESIAFKISIDVWSRQIIKVSPAEGGRDENFSAYGALPVNVDQPKDTIPLNELQAKIQAVQ